MKQAREDRTLRDFVEDKVSDGRDLKHILAVATNTRWRGRKEEIQKIYSEFVR